MPLPHFVAPNTIRDGDTLRIVNKTNARAVGPHTFSLVTRKAIPRTKPERKNARHPHHICFSIAIWHGVTGPNSPPTKNPANAGPDGWSTLGNLKRKGDSWFTGVKRERVVRAGGQLRPEQGPEATLLLLRDPSLDARLDQGAALGEIGKSRLLGPAASGGGHSSARSAAALWRCCCRCVCGPAACCPSPSGAAHGPRGRGAFRRRLPIPRKLSGADLRIPIRQARLQILPGRKTRMWTYGGTFPGPTIRRRAGELTRVTFDHKLPQARRAS